MRFKSYRGIKRSYADQGYIYFVSRHYAALSERRRAYIDELCYEIGGDDKWKALRAAVTEGNTLQWDAMHGNMDASALWRMCEKYYSRFDIGVFDPEMK